MLIDSHCHLNFPEFKDDLTESLKRAWDLGVRGFLTVNTKLEEAKDLQAITDTHKNIWCSVGVHPHEAEKYTQDKLLEEIKTLADHSKVIALGETGLDYYYEHSPRELQKKSFGIHLEAAKMLDLPVIIHTRDADQDTLEVIDESGKDVRGVFHCFSGTLDLCKQALERGFYISMSGIVTFKKADALREVAKYVPSDRLLVETDAPYLAPLPHRGKRNEPAFVVHTAELVAEIRGMPYPKLCDITTENFFTLFTKAQESFDACR